MTDISNTHQNSHSIGHPIEEKCAKNTINQKIEKLMYSIEVTRRARIYKCERLYDYADNWEFIILMMNVISSFLLIFALIRDETGYQLTISACYSIYTMLMQFYYSTLNYRERGLRLHYHQLELERFVKRLEDLLIIEQQLGESEKIKEFKNVRNLYFSALQEAENHSTEDFEQARFVVKGYQNNSKSDASDQKETAQLKSPRLSMSASLRDWTGYGDLDKFSIRMQYAVFTLVIISYVVFGR